MQNPSAPQLALSELKATYAEQGVQVFLLASSAEDDRAAIQAADRGPTMFRSSTTISSWSDAQSA